MLEPPFPRNLIHELVINGYRVEGKNHCHTAYLFQQKQKRHCDHCGEIIPQGELTSVGIRVVWFYGYDDEYEFQGEDQVHWYCMYDIRTKYQTPSTSTSVTTLPPLPSLEHCWKNKELEHIPQDVKTIQGFASLTEEDRKKFLEWNLQPATQEDVKVAKPLTGLICILVGEFSTSKTDLMKKICDLGGQVKESLTKDLNCCVAGTDGTTEYGQPTGKKSKKFKDFKKKKPKAPVLSEDDLQSLMSKTEDDSFVKEYFSSSSSKRKVANTTDEQTSSKKMKK